MDRLLFDKINKREVNFNYYFDRLNNCFIETKINVDKITIEPFDENEQYVILIKDNLIEKLRKNTGYGKMDCYSALIRYKWNIENTFTYLTTEFKRKIY